MQNKSCVCELKIDQFKLYKLILQDALWDLLNPIQFEWLIIIFLINIDSVR